MKHFAIALALFVPFLSVANEIRQEQAPKGVSGLVCGDDVSDLNSDLWRHRLLAVNTFLSTTTLVHFSSPYSVSAPSTVGHKVCVTVTQN